MSSNNKKQPRRDGSGRGVRANIGRGGCEDTEPIGLGQILNFGMARENFEKLKTDFDNTINDFISKMKKLFHRD